MNTVCATIKSGGIKVLTGELRLWSISTHSRRDRLRHEPGAVSHL